jgi:large subunit ribosomal protein L22
MAEIKAKLTNYRQSPRKVRLIADLVRGKQVEKAITEIEFLNKKASGAFTKLLNSAVANAEHNFNTKKSDLFVKEIRVDKGLVMKRFMPRAFGRAAPIRKKMSHITLVLGTK